jgi:NitT/TauT family transport system substrate-binding protein
VSRLRRGAVALGLRRALGLPLLLAMLLAPACVPATTPAAQPTPPVVSTLKIGSLPTIGLAPVLIAQQRGYFQREGLSVEIVNFSNGAEIVPAVGGGQIDAALSVAPSAGLLNAVARGLEVKIVASNGTIIPHRNIGNIIVRKDLAPSSGFLDLKTLKPPIRAAATVEGILPHAILLLEAQKAGFAISDVSMSFLGLPDMNAALQSKQLDIAASGEPLITLAEQQGIAARWREMAEDFPNVPYSTMLYGPNLLTRDPDAGVRLMRAYLQATRDYEDAFSHNKDRDAIVGLLSDPLKTPAPLFKAIQDGGGLAFIDPNGAVHIETLAPILDLWTQQGLVQPGFQLASLVDDTPARNAVSTLGTYS